MDSVFKNVTSIINLARVCHLKTSSFKNRPSPNPNQFIFLTLSEISYHILFLLEKRLISSYKSFGKVLIWLIKHAGNYPSKYTFLQKLCTPIQSFIFSKKRFSNTLFLWSNFLEMHYKFYYTYLLKTRFKNLRKCLCKVIKTYAKGTSLMPGYW